MNSLLEQLCNLNGPSGNEDLVREFILERIKPFAETKVDALGNIIAFKQGKKRSPVKLLLDAHMDEVGFIITSITEEGYLRFTTTGGIDPSVFLARRVIINNKITGVISTKPIHLQNQDERKKIPQADKMVIDIGAKDKQEAEKYVTCGDYAVFDSTFQPFGQNLIMSKAIDDRAGCYILMNLLCSESEYDFYATFTVQEELGLRGAKTAAFSVRPDSCIVIEATTAADIAGVSEENQVCRLNSGPVISFMDNSTVYDREYYSQTFKVANELGIPCQTKSVVAGGNNSGAISVSASGVRTLSVSVPCRYLHSPYSVASLTDIKNTQKLISALIPRIASGKI
ncbi:MAG TPA: M42 family metallopeptidase [Clostridiales bacterium]|nr:M42 family metallopeptidase [Clostridiales bacterium]